MSEFEHGTNHGYINRGCRCDACKEAARQYRKAYRERKGMTTRRTGNIQHGTPNGYWRGCKCEPCRRAMRAWQNERSERAQRVGKGTSSLGPENPYPPKRHCTCGGPAGTDGDCIMCGHPQQGAA